VRGQGRESDGVGQGMGRVIGKGRGEGMQSCRLLISMIP